MDQAADPPESGNKSQSKNTQPLKKQPKRARTSQRKSRRDGQRGDGQQNRNSQQRSSRKPGRGRQTRSNTPLDKVRRSFFGCGRCSYFFSGVRALLGLPKLTQMAEAATLGWITLDWTPALRTLVERNFGLDLHSDTTYLQGSCIECGRAFTAHGDDDSAEITTFEIQSERQAAHLR